MVNFSNVTLLGLIFVQEYCFSLRLLFEGWVLLGTMISQLVKEQKSRVYLPDKDLECCILCKKKIDVKQEAVECQWCKRWEHWVCCKITDNEYKLLNSKYYVFCTSCCPKIPVTLSNFDNGG